MNARELAEPNTILRGLVGSQIHGLAVGGEDKDELGVCVEPWEHFFGLRDRFEQWTWRTKPEGVRSEAGDLDLVVYSLAKWARLALGGNPTVLALMFIPEEHLSVCTEAGLELQEIANLVIGDQIFDPYIGYMHAQRRRLVTERKKPYRPELVERYGYDVKYAGHLLRLGYQGIELAETGRMSLPMREPERLRIIDVRMGRVPQEDVLAESMKLEAQLVGLRDAKTLPPPNRAAVERWVIGCYRKRHPEQSWDVVSQVSGA